ncbi:CUB domain-containing protein [Lutibacter sp.]|uniref:CUB domain-containing protein n=1 Tax=Lutibacter sp. TaxID=1925666 RepID=UPI0025C628F5|nr:CUB domain-containing protein [Lutibacter sp.]MCF6180499.1 M4 family metallopeptidase [Lutibacter sp.]
MKKNYTKSILLIVFVLISTLSFGQIKQQSLQNFVNPFQNKPVKNTTTFITPSSNKSNQQKPKNKIKNGSFFIKLKKGNQSNKSISSNFNTLFELNSNHTFQKINTKTDKLGFTHTNYQQFYKGYAIDGNLIMTHSKNGITNSINGILAKFKDFDPQINISKTEAKNIAKNYLKVTKLITDYPVKTVITQILTKNGVDTRLAYKVRIDSYTPFEMCNLFIDTKTGKVINKINLIANADTSGTAQTLYSGTQNITFDSYSGGYRLRESGRNIETYNATNATGLTTAGFTGSTDFTNASTSWNGVSRLSSFTISNIAQSWWYTVFADVTPDLYIKIKDGSNQTVYTSNYFNNTNPSVTFSNLNILLTNPPYTAEIWDYDAVNSDDFGGSYAIATSSGTQSWSGSGNNGTYLISVLGNPALDVHWGMEETYDFYLNIFSRNSYDGSGSIIRQYLNPPPSVVQSVFGSTAGLPNNAFAAPSPYNLMVYGMGDGTYMKPLVGIDVEGHEFSHMVINNNGNGGLTYQGESGGLNESFADIFGTCIEFYSGVNPDWTIGEDVMVSTSNLRSMSNPNNPTGISQQPDTYNGTYWVNTADTTNDHGGVHTNSGVQNFWFYLLSQGGSGTNDISNTYSVTGIGIANARQIAYRNLVTYLTPNATYMDAYYGSLQSAEDLYGNPSTQYTSVRQAWYAVGIGNDPNNYCSGTTNLTATSGTITDGSGLANYNDNRNCSWLIAPKGATQISLTFSAFDTEPNNDVVTVYDGPNDTYPILATWWGNTLPPTISTSSGVGAMYIKFISDTSINANGWSANYTTISNAPTCNGGTILSTPTGSFSDGSGVLNYGNNQMCYWFIAPPCANTVTLSLSELDTELDYDGLVIYDDLTGTHQIATLSGSTLPSSVTSTTGVMTVVFISDFSTTGQGFLANYTSTGSTYCSDVTILNTSDYGTISDGSGTNNYCNNSNCSWLIQPPQATSVTLRFTGFELENATTDGNTIYDAVEIYDGTSENATLLGRFTGSNIPPNITSSGGSMFVRFYSDISDTYQGWSANYISTEATYCNGSTTNLTAINGAFSDGSDVDMYSNNSYYSWLIQPTSANSITLSFSEFDTELDYDGVIVYDGVDDTSPVLGTFTGTTIPSPVTSTGGSMFVLFLSDESLRSNGWKASYNSITLGVNDLNINENIKLFPNPTSGIFTIQSEFNEKVTVQLFDVLGKQVLKSFLLKKGINNINASYLSEGIYYLKFYNESGSSTKKLIIK